MTDVGPLTVDDRLDIMDLAARYAWAMDGGMPDDYAGVFVPDAVHDPGQGRYLGRDAIHGMEAGFPSDAAFPGTKHLVSQFIIEGNTNRASVRMYVARFTAVPGTSSVELAWTGYYTDTVVKVDGIWYFEQKKAHYPDELLLQQFGQEEAPGLRYTPPQLHDQIGLRLPRRPASVERTR
jgi:hypothetical protein